MTEFAQVVRSACPSAVIDGEALQRFANALHISGSGSASRRLAVILDYDLTVSRADAPECHSHFGGPGAPPPAATPLLPPAFRAAVSHLFAAMNPAHTDHAEVAGDPEAPGRPHRFWTRFNELAVRHGLTRRMVREAVSAAGAGMAAASGADADHGAVAAGSGSGSGAAAAATAATAPRLIRPGVAAFLAACDAAGVPTVLLSAGVTQVIEETLLADGVALPPSCTLLANCMLFGGEGEGSVGMDTPCVGWSPVDPPSSREGKLHQLAALEHVLGGRPCALVVGDKPVDATVARGFPPLKGGCEGGGEGGGPTVLSFGFLNEPAPSAAQRAEYGAAFDVLAVEGCACSFAPLTALLELLLHKHTR